jgi:hypothetical protein
MNMSFSAAHESKAHRKTCHSCQARKARFRFRGAVRADRDHTLCFECYRAERDRRRARLFAEAEREQPAALRSPFRGASPLSERDAAHRRAMLAHCERGRMALLGVR